MRSLSPEEAQLWAKVAATITPLSREPAKTPAATAMPPPEASPLSFPARLAGRVPPSRDAGAKSARRTTIHGNLDGHWEKRLKNGTVAVDRTVDLHGHTLDRAWDAIDQALDRAISSGDRVLLLVTGHHRPGEPPVDRGKIRAAVHDWLAVSRHAQRIAAVRNAHRRHGGGGSLYLILRR